MSDERLEAIVGPVLAAALERLVDERVEAALAERDAGNGSPWLTLDEAAEYLRVSPRTLDRLLERGRIRTSAIGRRRLVHRDELEAYMRTATGEVTPVTQPRRRRRTLDGVDRGE